MDYHFLKPEWIKLKFGDEIVNNHINFMVINYNYANELLSNNNQLAGSTITKLEYDLYETVPISYILFDGERIPSSNITYGWSSMENDPTPHTPTGLCFNCDESHIRGIIINLDFLDNIAVGEHIVTFVSEQGDGVKARVRVIDSYIETKTYPLINSTTTVSLEPKNCINKDNEFIFDNVDSIDEFSQLRINNQTVLRSNYDMSLSNNELKITFKKAFVSSLVAGVNYTLKAEFAYGSTSKTIKFGYCNNGSNLSILSGKHQIVNLNDNNRIAKVDLYNKGTSIKSILFDGNEELNALPSTMVVNNPQSSSGYVFNCSNGTCSTYTINIDQLSDISTGEHIISFIGNDGSVVNAYVRIINSETYSPKNYSFLATDELAFCGDSSIVFTINNASSGVSSLSINNQPVFDSNYSVIDAGGRTEIILKKEFLATLTPGVYAIKVTYVDGTASITFSIKEAKECNEEMVSTLVYKVVEGDKQVVNTSKTNKIEFKVNADIEKFVNVYINNKVVDKTNYKLTKGSTIITFNEAYIKTLKNGQYNVMVEFNDGIATTSFVVNNAEIDNPHTGANISLTVVALGVVGYLIIKSRKRKIYNI